MATAAAAAVVVGRGRLSGTSASVGSVRCGAHPPVLAQRKHSRQRFGSNVPPSPARLHPSAPTSSAPCSPSISCCAAAAGSEQSPTDSEQAGWEKRREESAAAGVAAPDTWQWTLNWNEITPGILVGSCPRSAADVDRLVNEAGVQAILNLQSDACFEALQIPYPEIRQRAVDLGVLYTRTPVFDFDHNDQAKMLPVAARQLNVLMSLGKKTYVHCTAGINRASLTVVAYLTFVKGMRRAEAVAMVREARPVANPYMDCLDVVRKRILEGRTEELTYISKSIYEDRCKGGVHGNMETDWRGAQGKLITQTFERFLEADLYLLNGSTEVAVTDYKKATKARKGNGVPNDVHKTDAHSTLLLERELDALRHENLQLQKERDGALATAAMAREEASRRLGASSALAKKAALEAQAQQAVESVREVTKLIEQLADSISEDRALHEFVSTRDSAR
eukprot:jgi/Chlat1/4586/Chrsp290S04331